MKLYRKILFGLASLITSFVFAQEGSLSGSLQDQMEETIPFATVAVMKLPDSTVVTGTTTEMDGRFEMGTPERGEYLLRFSAIGFKSTFTEPFSISALDFEKDFGAVVMETAVTALDEVMIQTWRPRVKVENGKMVMKVEGTAIAAGSTAYEMLSRAPGVSVGQNGEFSINGKKGVAVMIDGRLNYLSGFELQTLLEGMPAENIEEIEVINNPSAKYDAEGAAGILNIKLKQNSLTGINGAVYAGFKYRDQSLFNGGINLNHKRGKWNSFLNLDLSELGFIRDQRISRIYAPEEGLKFFDQVGEDYRKRFVPSIQIGTDYDLSDRHSIGAVVNYTYQDRLGDWHTTSDLRNAANQPLGIIQARNYSEEDRGLGRFNVHYTGALDTIGTRISADIDLVRLEKEVDYRFTNFYTYPDDSPDMFERLYSNSQSDYDIFSGQIDLNMPLSENATFATGLKASKVISDSELKYFREENDSRVFDPTLSDRFRYEEEIFAAYITYSNRFNETWNLNLGLRAEQTVGKGTSFSLDQENSKDYFKLFPNLSLEQKVSKNYSLNYSFSRRITRPDYERMNPVIFYLDPYTYAVGNPGLKPQINNNFQISQTFFRKFHLLLSYDYAKNFMIEIPSTDPETLESSLSERNLDHMTTYGATVVAPFELAAFWNVNNNLVLNQQENELVIDGEKINNDNFFYMLQSNHQFALPAGLKMELNATYRGPVAYGVYEIDKQWWLDVGLKKSFMNDNLNVSLNATDIFRTMDMHVTAEYTGNSFVLDQYFGNQAVSINIRYNFSKGSKTEKKSRQNDLEEMSRAGG